MVVRSSDRPAVEVELFFRMNLSGFVFVLFVLFRFVCLFVGGGERGLLVVVHRRKLGIKGMLGKANRKWIYACCYTLCLCACVL